VKTREFERLLVREGCVIEKRDGDHAVYRLPNGHRIDVPRGGKYTECPSYLQRRFRKLQQMPIGESNKGLRSGAVQTRTKV